MIAPDKNLPIEIVGDIPSPSDETIDLIASILLDIAERELAAEAQAEEASR